MNSNLEKAPDKILFKILKEVIEGYSSFREFRRDLSDYAEKIMGMTTPFGTKEKMMDVDYILSVVELNFNNIKNSDTLQEPLQRPKLGKYEVEYKVGLTEYKTQWYTTKVSSYSKTSSKEIMEFDYQNGDFEWYEGNMTYEDVHDSETHSLDFTDSSLISEEKNLRKIIKDNISKV
jgi:hypothetical protein